MPLAPRRFGGSLLGAVIVLSLLLQSITMALPVEAAARPGPIWEAGEPPEGDSPSIGADDSGLAATATPTVTLPITGIVEATVTVDDVQDDAWSVADSITATVTLTAPSATATVTVLAPEGTPTPTATEQETATETATESATEAPTAAATEPPRRRPSVNSAPARLGLSESAPPRASPCGQAFMRKKCLAVAKSCHGSNLVA